MGTLALIVGSKELNRAVVGVIKSTTSAQERIHLVACSTLAHAEEHGDLTLFARLVYGLPKGVKVAKLRQWARISAPVVFNDKDLKVTLDKGDKAPTWNLEQAQAVAFYDIQTEKKEQEFSFEAVLESLAKKAKAKDGDTAEDTAARQKIAELVAFGRVIAAPKQDAANAEQPQEQAA